MGNRLSVYDQLIGECVMSPSNTTINTSLGEFELFPKNSAVSHYIDGREKPHCRGFLHFIVSYSIPCVILLRAFEPSSVKWFYLLYKLVPYLMSSFHHFYDFKTVDGLEYARWVDARMLNVSIAATAVCFSNVHYSFHVAMCLLGVGYDNNMFKCSYALGSMLSILWSGVSVNLWCFMMANYIGACVLFARKLSGKGELTHHSRKWWGFHEDFHLLMFVGDLIPLLF
jgi:hypothetical protein